MQKGVPSFVCGHHVDKIMKNKGSTARPTKSVFVIKVESQNERGREAKKSVSLDMCCKIHVFAVSRNVKKNEAKLGQTNH